MAVKIGVPAETFRGERRVAMTPRAMDMLAKSGVELTIESGAGVSAGFPDGEYREKGGYAKAMGEEFYRKQREALGNVLAEQNVVITTAAVPGKKAPVLITGEMAARMAPGSVIVDIAAERGGNCELTRPGETVVANGVSIQGPVNLPSTIPYHASQMYAKNIATFLKLLVKDGQIALNPEDEIVRETLVTRGGEVVHPRVRESMGALNAL